MNYGRSRRIVLLVVLVILSSVLLLGVVLIAVTILAVVIVLEVAWKWSGSNDDVARLLGYSLEVKPNNIYA